MRRALAMGGRCMLADEMGLGKSLQALCVVAALDAWPCLAVVPAVTRRGWAEEAELHLGGVLTPSDVHIVYDQFDALEESRPQPKLLIISPKMATKLEPQLLRREWRGAILDEAHTLRTSSTKEDPPQIQALLRLLRHGSATKALLLLTGTPAVTKVFDMFNQVDLLRPGLLGSSRVDFRNKCFDAVGHHEACKLPRQLPLLLHTFVMVRRTKAQLLTSLPPLTDICVSLPIERETYRAVVAEFGGDGGDDDGGGPHRGNATTRDTPSDDEGDGGMDGNVFGEGKESAEAEGEGGDALHEAGVKTTAERVGLLKAVELRSTESWLHRRLCALRYAATAAREASAARPSTQSSCSSSAAVASPAAAPPPRKLVVFAHHVRVMDCLEVTVRQALGAEFRCVRVDGSCVGVAKTALLDQFRDDRATLVALCSIRACGVGTDGMQHVADEALFVEVPDEPEHVRAGTGAAPPLGTARCLRLDGLPARHYWRQAGQPVAAEARDGAIPRPPRA